MKLLFENWRKYIKETALLQEEFYFVSDKNFERPLSNEFVQVAARKLPGGITKSTGELKASGAEGVVISLDDYRVIKMFHSLDNAAKNLPLISKKVPETAQVYSAGKFVLDQPIIYFKKGSSYSPTEAEAVKEIYYIVMQRVKPDPYIYRYINLAYNSFNRLSNVDFNKLIQLYSIDDEKLKHRIDEIFRLFMQDPINEKFPVKFTNIHEFMQNASKKQKNVLTAQFNRFRKNKTKEFVISSQGKPVTLKQLLLNYLNLGGDSGLAEKIITFLLEQDIFKKRPKKSFSKNTIGEDLIEVIGLIKTIRIDKKIPWKDIHEEQFGRNKDNNLIALDLGVKGAQDINSAAAAFNKNVSQLASKGLELKLIKEGNFNEFTNIKTLNVYDFDLTLFFTHGAEEGKRKYEQVFNREYPHIGWFGKEESLSDELDIKRNEQLKTIYDTLKTEPNSLSVLISNRIFKLQNRLKKFLADRGYFFDDILLRKGGQGKAERLENIMLNNEGVNKINIFDDLDAALEEYKKLRDLYSVWREDLQFNIFKVTPTGIIKVQQDKEEGFR